MTPTPFLLEEWSKQPRDRERGNPENFVGTSSAAAKMVAHIHLTLDASSDSNVNPAGMAFSSHRPRSPTAVAGIYGARGDSSTSRSPGNYHRTTANRVHVSPLARRLPSGAPPPAHAPYSQTIFEPIVEPRAAQFSPSMMLPPDHARDMARPSSVGVSTGSQQVTSQQVTPPLEPQPAKICQPIKVTTPKAQTPRRSGWDIPRIVDSLKGFQQDIKRNHAQLAAYLIDSTEAIEQRVHTGTDLFANLKAKPSEQKTEESLRVKFKQHKQHSKFKKDGREARYEAVCIPTNEERVPRYRFHHVEIKKNMLTPNTMLTFVPHLRDLESSEESKYSGWLLELEEIDRKSGFKPLKQDDKLPLTHRSEYAATVSMYLDDWLEKLAIPGCNKSTLIRYMANQVSDDAITPRQKSDILNSHREAGTTTSSEANKVAEMFTEAFDQAFRGALPPITIDAHQKGKALKERPLQLQHVLSLDEAVDSAMDSKPTAKDGTSSQKDEDELVEYNLGTYCILGCVICYSHSCEHGEYDSNNEKRTLSITPRLSDVLKRRRCVSDPDHIHANGHASSCARRCHVQFKSPPEGTRSPPWSEDEHDVLRSILVTAEHSKVKRDKFCLAADFLDRDCFDVYRESQNLQIKIPERQPPPKQQTLRHLSWYDRFKKALIGDWHDHIVTHEHQRRELLEPCSHDGPCTSESCTCVQNNLLCEKLCHCTSASCAYKFTGCACHSQGKTCMSKQKDRPCICVQLNRECDPELCGSCGVLERADPLNAEDEALHLTGCQNCALQRGEQKALVLGQSQLEGVGYGLFTAEDISQDDFIIEYVGELISHDEGVRREARRGDVFDEESSISYVFTLLENEGIWVDAATYGNLSRYINHASESDKRGCNITPRILYVNGEYRIKFTAMRDIKAGEELFFNYGENFPNLTKKLLDDKAGGKRPPSKDKDKKPRRQRAEDSEGATKKVPKTDKKKVVKSKPAAPATPLVNFEDDALMADLSAKPSRKRKRNLDDSEEEEYHPTGTDATASLDEALSPTQLELDEPSGRLRRRTRKQQPKLSVPDPSHITGEPKARGKRGGARPGSGRPKKYRRGPKGSVTLSVLDATPPQPQPSAVAFQVPKLASPDLGTTGIIARLPPHQSIRNIMDEIEDSEDGRDDAMQRLIEDEYAKDESQDSIDGNALLDREKRNRRLPAKFREEEEKTEVVVEEVRQ